MSEPKSPSAEESRIMELAHIIGEWALRPELGNATPLEVLAAFAREFRGLEREAFAAGQRSGLERVQKAEELLAVVANSAGGISDDGKFVAILAASFLAAAAEAAPMSAPRVSDERLRKIAPDSGPCEPVELWEAHALAYDLRESRRDLEALRTRLAAVERERDELRATWSAQEQHGAGCAKCAAGLCSDFDALWEKWEAAIATPGPVPEERG